MKLTKKAISLLLIVMMLMSAATLGFVGVSAASSVKLTYNYLYNNAGYAEGKVKLEAASTADYGTYWFYWADDTVALDGFAEITTMTLNRDSKSFAFDEFTVIPAGATKLIAIKSTSEPASKAVASASAVYSIPQSKQFKYSESDKEYDFAAFSDIHIHKQNPPYYTYSELHFSQALEAAADRDLDFVTVCGDAINGYASLYATEWAAYQKVIANSSYCNPIYETIGNHETKSDGDKAADVPYTYGINTYKTATGLNVQTEKMQEESYYEITAPNGDHFIFMVLELDSSPNESGEFTTAQLDWLEGLLNKYKNDGKNIFIYEHALIESYGAGDDKVLPLYAGGLQQTYPQVKRLISLLEANPEVHFISGHTHLDFKYGYNIDNRDGETCYTIHIPSLSSPTQIVGGAMDYTMYEDKSQGYFVDVYEDAVVYNGTDLCTNEYLPLYCYFIDQSGETLSKNDIGGDDDANTEVAQVNVDISSLSKNPEYGYCYAFDEDGNATKYPGILMEKQSDGTYSCEVPVDFTKMYFFFNDATLGRIGTDIYEVNNCKIVVGSDKIVYENPNNWSTVYAYVWTSTNTPFEWPGLLMTKGSDGKYSVSIPGGDAFDMIIFTNGSGSKTIDLAMTEANFTKYKFSVVTDVEGSYTVTEPVVRPTVPTEPQPSEDTTEPTATETPIVTDPRPTSPSSEPDGEYIYGDADLNGDVNIKDATAIQKHSAGIITLEGKAFIQANVTGDSAVNVRDATAVQKRVANIIDSFPIEDKTSQLASVGASSSELTTLISTVKSALSAEYKYASYDAYMALKKQYYAYKDKPVSSMSVTEITNAYNAINGALTDYNTMKKNNGGSSTLPPTGEEVTVYFTNNKSWSTVKAYLWNSSTNANMGAWPGVDMTYVKTNSQNQKIYSVTYDPSAFDKIIFNNGNNGGSQTVDISLTGENGVGYYISGGSGKSLTCSTYTFS
ncbi:MAG: starch-binding protein [Ruminococcus sp.]